MSSSGNRLGVVVLLVILLVGACGGEQASGGGRVQIVATTSMLGDLVRNVTGDGADVEVLMPAGADPHSFSPSSQQVAMMSKADLVVANGLGLEAEFQDVLDGIVADGGRLLEIAPRLDPLQFGSESDQGESLDPHVWLDPVRMAEAARIVAAELGSIDDSVDWSPLSEEYANELLAVDAEIEAMVSSIAPEDRVLVTNHDALGYFAERYGFEVVGTVIPGGSTLGDPSSQELSSLVALMKELGVNVIFAETTRPAALADAVTAELGEEAKVVELYTGSLGDEGSGADSLIGMLRTDAMRVADALGEA